MDCDDDINALWCAVDAFELSHVFVRVVVDGVRDESSDDKHDEMYETEQSSWDSDEGMSDGINDDDDDIISSSFPLGENNVVNLGWDKIRITKNQRFEGGVIEIRESLQKMAVHTGFRYTYTKNAQKRITVVCKLKNETNCEWNIHAVKEKSNSYFYVKKICTIHTCGTSCRSFKGSTLSSTMVSKIISNMIHKKPNTTATHVRFHLFEVYGYKVSYDMAWAAVEKARADVLGDVKRSFTRLNSYVESVLRTNPGSRLSIEVHPTTHQFQRIFVAFDACIRGFRSCRPMLFLDGTHLKGQIKGHLLAATCEDGNNGLYPLCFSVVKSEDYNNWHWFLRHLRSLLCNDRKMNFLSDRNTGLLQALPQVFPDAYHSYCIFHIKLNMRDKFKGPRSSKFLRNHMLELLHKCAFAKTTAEFHMYMDEMLREGRELATEFFKDLKPENWSIAYYKGCRYGHTASTIDESFNKMIMDERHLPGLNMIDGIRKKVMVKMEERRNLCTSWNSMICPKIDAILHRLMDVGRNWNVANSTLFEFEVQSNPTHSVNFSDKTCTCPEWQRRGYPCAHALAALSHTSFQLYDFVDPCFLRQSYAESYNFPIYPIPSVDHHFEEEVADMVLPPNTGRLPGRPRKRRFRSRGEAKHPMRCSRCNVVSNHNPYSCNLHVNDPHY